ncbi:MAG: hypothetical protein QW165_03785 [Candidatus Woesearchaeota archaeon]
MPIKKPDREKTIPANAVRSVLPILLLILLIPTTFAADWVEVSIRQDWDRKSTGFCKTTSQCLVSNAFSDAWDNFPDRYWSEQSNANRPKCIENGQFIEDNYCDMGSWSSRTRLVATQLLSLALNQSPNAFSIYCDSYPAVLNRYAYRTDYGPVISFLDKFCLQPGNRFIRNCVNNICVLRYGNTVAFGTALNTDINGQKSPLQALNLSPTACDNALNQDNDYDFCTFSVWYNHDTKSIIYAPTAVLPPINPLTNAFFMTPYNKLKDYVFTNIHKPDIAQYNYTFFNQPPAFKNIYISKDDIDFVYSFKQENITLTQIDYAGWYFSNIHLPPGACDRIIKRYDGRANCEVQPSPAEFYIVAHKTPPVNKFDTRQSIVDAWKETVGMLRVFT